MNRNKKDYFKKARNIIRRFLPIERIKILIAVLVVICIYAVVHISGFDMDMECERSTQICTISKISPNDPTPINISRFDTTKIYDIAVSKRKLKNNKVIYDILLNYGADNGQAFIDYGFTNPINANNVMMQFGKYLETGMSSIKIRKHCYFNEYFCFVRGKNH